MLRKTKVKLTLVLAGDNYYSIKGDCYIPGVVLRLIKKPKNVLTWVTFPDFPILNASRTVCVDRRNKMSIDRGTISRLSMQRLSKRFSKSTFTYCLISSFHDARSHIR